MGIQVIDYYVARRQLMWLGHVSRMSADRIPRRMLSCWINNKRPKGRPEMTYGSTMKKQMAKFGIEFTSWPTLARDEQMWSDALTSEKYIHKIKKNT